MEAYKPDGHDFLSESQSSPQTPPLGARPAPFSTTTESLKYVYIGV